jgi:UDP-N-acetylglucosamine--N-acetylmuramyl-(pentapeptide) pyrophosphoryl-undecaprenol N-acetylglucosamine transferase
VEGLEVNKKILITAGGTGGHIFPGIAIAKALQKQNISVIWLGSQNGMENNLVPKANIPLFTISISGFRGKSIFKKLLMPFILLSAIYKAYKILKIEKPNIVLGMGGFVAGPAGIAAKCLGIPLMIHEQNNIAGFTNRILAKIASRVFCAFPNTFSTSSKIIFTGNPVREDIKNIASKQNFHRPLRLLILGGSRGAKILNDIVPEAIKLLPSNIQPEIYHQTGENNSANYSIPATIVPFIDNISEIYNWADVVICRAGALTLAELTTIGLPAILIPYPHAVDDHQTSNALYLSKNNAAILLPQSECSPQKLGEIIIDLFNHPKKYLEMAKASKALGIKDSEQKILQIIYQVFCYSHENGNDKL